MGGLLGRAVLLPTFASHLPVGVAVTVGRGRFGALVGAMFWNIVTWLKGIPSSSSHALVGGIVAVIYADAFQTLVLIAGAVVSAVIMVCAMPEGPGQVFRIAGLHDKFSLGDFGAGLAAPTFWVVFAYGLVINLQNFGIDQSFVQRYQTAFDSAAYLRCLDHKLGDV